MDRQNSFLKASCSTVEIRKNKQKQKLLEVLENAPLCGDTGQGMGTARSGTVPGSSEQEGSRCNQSARGSPWNGSCRLRPRGQMNYCVHACLLSTQSMGKNSKEALCLPQGW